ncbi:hypothetical protein SLITO_v1c08920 [Spiroplasma litorale]|uniref:Uncharacterized protein n=1 Tax=Spiroplasma litorale TaxID=216942 RepID=A0A0K1W2V2_9MOLU|nr:hypothetical protein [Spiroplasma litorale]AKX34506.1 hypothetical protein SLITO_v1c08920 [Spiroplasma litorale]
MTLPYWVILIILVIVLVLYLVIPWKKIRKWRQKKSDIVNKPENEKNIEEKNSDHSTNEEESNKSKQSQKPIFGIYNWFGSKQALRNKILVYVKEEKDCCDLCAPFEGKVLSLEKYDKDYLTMQEAISKGYHHIGCKHIDIDYYPNKTKIPNSKYSVEQKKEEHKNVLGLYKLEQELRNLIYKFDNKEDNVTEIDVKNKKNEIIMYCKTKSVKRNPKRENPYIPDYKKFR